MLPVRHLLVLRDKSVPTESGAASDPPGWVRDYALFLLTPDGMVAAWYSGAERIYGFTNSEIVGHSVEMLYPSEAGLAVRLREELQRSATEAAKTCRRADCIGPILPRRNTGRLTNWRMKRASNSTPALPLKKS